MGVMDRLAERFMSGNSIPVERAHITAAEFAELKALADATPACMALMEAARPLVLSLERIRDAQAATR